jgi:predicted SAM-dependent methyltransferase
MLELGSGPVPGRDGWTTIDRAPGCDLWWDLMQPLPFPANSVACIYSSHTLEHFYLPDAERLLRECHRVLQQNGTLSVCVPNARIYLDAYFHSEGFNTDLYCSYRPALSSYGKMDLINYVAYMGGHHRYMFDSENLSGLLTVVGFRNVRPRPMDPSRDKVERHHESIYAIATK